GLLGGRKDLSRARVGKQKTGDQAHDRQSEEKFVHCCPPLLSSSAVLVLPLYGMAGLGRGGTPQMACGQAGSVGVGMRVSFPCVDAEPPDVHVPVKVPMLGYGVVKPSVSVCMKRTSWFSSRSVKPSIP